MTRNSGAHRTDATLGARVRALRGWRRCQSPRVVPYSRMGPATLSQIENGRTGLNAVRLGHIADARGLTVAQILDIAADTGEPSVQQVQLDQGPRRSSASRRHDRGTAGQAGSGRHGRLTCRPERHVTRR